jgi:hypothetical protein
LDPGAAQGSHGLDGLAGYRRDVLEIFVVVEHRQIGPLRDRGQEQIGQPGNSSVVFLHVCLRG